MTCTVEPGLMMPLTFAALEPAGGSCGCWRRLLPTSSKRSLGRCCYSGSLNGLGAPITEMLYAGCAAIEMAATDAAEGWVAEAVTTKRPGCTRRRAWWRVRMVTWYALYPGAVESSLCSAPRKAYLNINPG